MQTVSVGGAAGTPVRSVTDSVPNAALQPRFLVRLPQSFLLGVWSSYYQPAPPQQPFLNGLFGRLIEVGDDGHVVAPANVVIGCTNRSDYHGQYNFDALPVEAGQILAVQSAGSASSCPADNQPVTGTSQIHLLLRTTAGTIEPVQIFAVPATSVHLFPSTDGAWLLVPNQSFGNVERGSTISLARLDKRGRPLTPLIALQDAELIAGASVGSNRLALAVRNWTGFRVTYALELLDENGSLTAIMDMPRILGLVSSTTEDRLLVSKSGTALYDNTVQIVRYDHVCRSAHGPTAPPRAHVASAH
ncbi:MAG TPA: hypothetical protein VK550_02085 [Polyangiaceae bacterium]|nr:hypothetical protein [Polyangiaceae bacterium]